MKIKEGEIYKDLEVISLNYRKDGETNNYLSKCKCIHCGDIKDVRTRILREKGKHKCEKCRELYLQSFVGKKYNKLEIISYSHSKNGHPYFNCLCECGNTKCVLLDHLKTGHTKSCGCLWVETIK